ncbi:FAD-dependent oxidoreductase [Oxalobacteraceae bacterium OM1]|nr:FAD-dependent oxidoreductase [Oxalobacteraceae bacterium OM1]
MTQKQIVVIGGGVVGVCTAYFLAEAGHDVAVIERHHNVAQESSFAHAGIVAPDGIGPWAAPGMPRLVLRQMLRNEAPVLLRARPNRTLWRWAQRWMDECQLDRFRINVERMQRIGAYSRDVLRAMRDHYQIDYERSDGVLQVFRTAQDVRMAQPMLDWMAENEIPHKVLDPDAARAVEPALGTEAPFVSAVHLPRDEAGNCPLFAKRLRHIAASIGVQFFFTSRVESLNSHAGRVALMVDGQEFSADAVVIAAGMDSIPLLQPLGIHVPLYPVRGYSLTASIKNFDQTPSGAVYDEAYKAAVVRLGGRMRVSGLAEVGTPSPKLREAALRTLIKVGSDWFPQTANYVTASVWTGVQPMLPDGPPLLGGTPLRNVYINLGHGSSGWAMAAGSGKVVADLISGRSPDIDLDGLTLARYG